MEDHMPKADYVRKEKNAHPGQQKTRRCLKCRTPFASEWSGERVCPKCKTTRAWREGWGEGMAASYG